MSRLSVSSTEKYLVKDGKPFFYLADTVWSVFVNASLEEWEEYLKYRRLQGFTVLQINVLYQWDIFKSERDMHPFFRKEDGSYEFDRINEEYFKRAQSMLDMAAAKGFTPALVLLWCNYVPGTWASRRNPEQVMPLSAVKPYVEYAVRCFSPFDPIYIISGDTDLDSTEAERYYLTVLETVKELCPQSLASMHLAGSRFLTETFLRNRHLDFYMFQSGHGFAEDEIPIARNPSLLAQKFHQLPDKKPVVNGEPCYEGINSYDGGRFSSVHVRKAIWESLLSGAGAGTAYGAHGVWSWHRRPDKSRTCELEPFDWRAALRFEGAWDAAYAKWVYETYDLFGLEPADGVVNGDIHIRMAADSCSDRLVVYIPYSRDVELNIDISGYCCTLLDIKGKVAITPEIESKGSRSIIRMSPFNSDTLFIARKK